MAIGSLSGSSSPAAQKAADNSGADIAKLEQQKKSLQDQITRIKEDDKIAPEVKKKQLAVLQKKLKNIESTIQKISAEQKNNTTNKKSSAEKSSSLESSTTDDRKNMLRDPIAESNDKLEQMRKNKKQKQSGNFLNLYA